MSDISKKILDKVPHECEECNNTRIEFYEETEKEYLFRCIDCGAFYPIPINPDKLPLYPEL